MRDIAMDHFNAYLRYHRGIERFADLVAVSRRSLTQGIVFWGPPGSGKTRAAVEFASSVDHLFAVIPGAGGSQSLWFDGYAGHRVILFDDFYGWVPRHFLCRLLDRLPMRLQVKCGHVQFVSRYCILTSNVPPKHFYQSGLGMLERRFDLQAGVDNSDLGCCVYVGNSAFPTEESYLESDLYSSFCPRWASTGDFVSVNVI